MEFEKDELADIDGDLPPLHELLLLLPVLLVAGAWDWLSESWRGADLIGRAGLVTGLVALCWALAVGLVLVLGWATDALRAGGAL